MKTPDINRLKEFFNSRIDVVAAYVFGSYASDKLSTESDIDIAVLLDEKVRRKDYSFVKQEIITALIENLSFNKVDVVLLNTAPPLLCHEVIKKGTVICSRNEEKRIEFTVKAAMRYLDTIHLRNIQDRIIHERIRSGDFGYFKGSHKYSIEKIR